MASGSGSGKGVAGLFWALIWFLILIFLGWPVGFLIAWLYILLLPFGACISPIKDVCDSILKVVQLPYTCAVAVAFDRVCHSTLFLQLIELRVPPHVIRILRFWFTNQTMFVSWNGHVSDGFVTRNGARQGGVLSPALFNIYINRFSVELNKLNIGCLLNTVLANHLLYADDLCLMSPSLVGLRLLVAVCERVAIELSVRFNAKKSVCVRFLPKSSNDIPLFPVLLNEAPLTYMDEVKYLGHTISSDLSDAADMKACARGLYARGNSLVQKFKLCSEEVKIVLFRSYITPLYCCHLWVHYTQQQLSQVRVAYHSVFRKLFRLTYRDSMSWNLVNRCLPTLKEIIRKNTFSIYGRFKRSGNPVAADVCHPTACISSDRKNFWSRFS